VHSGPTRNAAALSVPRVHPLLQVRGTAFGNQGARSQHPFRELPAPKYCRKSAIVPALGERMPVKKCALFRAWGISKVSTPELRMITDEGWWMPTSARLEIRVPLLNRRDSPPDGRPTLERRRTRKITFLAPLPPIIRNNVQFKPVFCGRENQTNCGGNRHHWRFARHDSDLIIRPMDRGTSSSPQIPDLEEWCFTNSALIC
jgi:hypothetical protein